MHRLLNPEQDHSKVMLSPSSRPVSPGAVARSTGVNGAGPPQRLQSGPNT